MGVDGSVPCSTCQIFAITEWNVLAFGVLVALCETEIDDVHSVLLLVFGTDHEVVRLDISVDNALIVDSFDQVNHLNNDADAGFGVKSTLAVLEQVFKTLAEKVHDHDVEHLAIFSFLVSNEVQEGNFSLSA